MNIILYAIPFFFLLIGLELLLEKVKHTSYYRVNDAVSSLSAGVLSRMIGVMKNIVPFTLYVLVYENAALFSLPDTLWMWITAFILYDFFYYWNHRFGHEVSLFWASHVVHHSSEDYNLSTALRQSSGGFFGFIFYLPMALMGFSPLVLLTVGSLNLVYQFWVHTQHVGKLGWYEWIFITPSNHRVHHAQNQIYLDRNYGGVFILWDRLFGSYQEELDDEKPIYGVRKALHSWNPFWANLQVYSQLVKDSVRTKRWSDKFKVWFGRTGWRPADMEQQYPLPRVDLSRFERYDTIMSTSAKLYCILQYLMTAILGVFLMMNASNMLVTNQLLLASFVVYSSVSVAWLMENRRFALWSEWIRSSLILASSLLLDMPQWLMAVLFFGGLISLMLMVQVKRSQKRQQTTPDHSDDQSHQVA
ncbi:MAG: sterol desaturase family protein [Aliiglaciecola sp.]|uniref:sterol desaturase family protein n=1 Tax=Aliiglaciecola sp. M165 TaxID=2593649 RepID=UPI00117C1080|nr:sterol desaturase family protein [Aliiglaciecola sp. M165]TRY33388.1 sterol desaturase family protein [Aliiglaciecola sp. M165]